MRTTVKLSLSILLTAIISMNFNNTTIAQHTSFVLSEKSATVSLYGFLRPKAEFREEIKKELLFLAELTRQEEGSLIFNIHEDKDGSFFLYELWRSQEDLTKHHQQSYLKNFMNKINDKLSKEIEAYTGQLLTPVK